MLQTRLRKDSRFFIKKFNLMHSKPLLNRNLKLYNCMCITTNSNKFKVVYCYLNFLGNKYYNFNFNLYKSKTSFIHSIWNKNVFLSSSNGSTSIKNFNNIILPSFKKVNINTNIFSKGINKLFFKEIPITKKSVRGIAKNPVDHPNGGNSNTKGSFKTPWSKIAKHNK